MKPPIKKQAYDKTTLTIERDGSFTVRTLGNKHCGTKPVQPIQYHIEVCCRVNLDDKGFLFDQLEVDTFFQGIKVTAMSCEELAVDCGRKLYKIIMVQNPNCGLMGLIVQLSPEPYAARVRFKFGEIK